MESRLTSTGRSRRPVPSVLRSDISNPLTISIWGQGKTKIGRLFGSTKTQPPRESTTPYLPNEILEMIIAYFPYDLDTLKACSLACRFWYIAVAPHIHQTLVLGRQKDLRTIRGGLRPLSALHGLNLTPFIKEIRVLRWGWPNGRFGPQVFNPGDLLHFSAFSSVQVLKIQGLEINRFFPDIEHYFKQFSSTLRSISLEDPVCGSPQQLSCFLSLFTNLDDVEIRGFYPSNAPTPKKKPMPFSAPSLRGRLALYSFCAVATWTNLIAVCGGLVRFQHMVLHYVGGCTPILLKACAKTLEKLRFYASDYPALSTYRLNLSHLNVLRSLEVGDWTSESGSPATWRSVILEVFKSITSPAFSEFVVVLLWSQRDRLLSGGTLFDTLRTMYEIKPFRLVFLFQVWYPPSANPQWMFEGMVESMVEKGLVDFLDSLPTIRAEPL